MRKLLFAVIASIFSFSAMAGGHADWFKKAGAPYSGTVLQGVAENTPPGQFAGEVLAKEFEKLTGIKVQLENTSWKGDPTMWNSALSRASGMQFSSASQRMFARSSL